MATVTELSGVPAVAEPQSVSLAPEPHDLTPAALKERLAAETEKRKLITDYIRGHLVAGSDYGMIHHWIGPKGNKLPCPNDGKHMLDANGNPTTCPICGAKHSLWKPGAEKIAGLMHVTATYSVDAETMTALAMQGKAIAYRVSLVSLQTGAILSEGRGAATLDGDYNKAIKMAKKSGLIDSVLGLAGLSSLFTQDTEDLRGARKEQYQGAEHVPSRDDIADGLADRFNGTVEQAGERGDAPDGNAGSPAPATDQERAIDSLRAPACPTCGKPCKPNLEKHRKAKAEGNPKPPPAWKCSTAGYDKVEKKYTGCKGAWWSEEEAEKAMRDASAAPQVPPAVRQHIADLRREVGIKTPEEWGAWLSKRGLPPPTTLENAAAVEKALRAELPREPGDDGPEQSMGKPLASGTQGTEPRQVSAPVLDMPRGEAEQLVAGWILDCPKPQEDAFREALNLKRHGDIDVLKMPDALLAQAVAYVEKEIPL